MTGTEIHIIVQNLYFSYVVLLECLGLLFFILKRTVLLGAYGTRQCSYTVDAESATAYFKAPVQRAAAAAILWIAIPSGRGNFSIHERLILRGFLRLFVALTIAVLLVRPSHRVGITQKLCQRICEICLPICLLRG